MLLLVQALDGVLIIGFLLIVTHVFAEQVVKPICEKRKSEDAWHQFDHVAQIMHFCLQSLELCVCLKAYWISLSHLNGYMRYFFVQLASEFLLYLSALSSFASLFDISYGFK